MNILIVEDEKYARINLENLIKELEPGVNISATIDSVEGTVNWLREHQADLIFLDIHLADSLSFDIFEQIEIKTPVIFTTAYDQYAIKAFKVNSIDYLLKPIDKEELRSALQKYHRLQGPKNDDINELRTAILNKSSSNYQKRFVVKKGEKIASVKTEEIAYFEGEDRYVYLIKNDGAKYFVDYKLADLENMVDPNSFFRLNRSFIANFEAIEEMVVMSKSRIKVNLVPEPSRPVVVSTDNTRLFKEWLNR